MEAAGLHHPAGKHPPAFLADRMLGRLARWLRACGCDCRWHDPGDDRDPVETALEQVRVLLTRNRRLLRRRRIGRHLLVASDHLEQQLLQVLLAFDVDPLSNPLSRCMRCNSPLEPATAEQAGCRVPYQVLQTGLPLARCPVCDRFYWPATHAGRMRRRLELLRRAWQAGRRQAGT